MLTCFTFLPNLVSGLTPVGYAMADYRVYLVGTDGNFCDVVPLVCADDVEAIEHAQRLAVGYDVELWQLDRKIAVFQDKDKNTMI
jgi:hypothetical protein